MNNFRVKHAEGIESEDKFVDLLIARGNTIIHRAPSDLFFPDYDIKIMTRNGEETTIEVKRDNNTNNNLYVEYSYLGGPSGISNSLASYYVFHKSNIDRFYYLDSDELRDWIEWYKQFKRPFSATCTQGHTKGYIVPVSVLKPIM